MMKKNGEQLAVGEVVGYTIGLNVLSAQINVCVKVDGKIIKIPVDYRQKKFIQDESPDREQSNDRIFRRRMAYRKQAGNR